MSLPVYVDAYAGYKPNERPRQFVLDEDIYEIAAVLDQWYEPSAIYFKVQSTEGKTYLLRYDERADEWTLQSGFDALSGFVNSIRLAENRCPRSDVRQTCGRIDIGS